MSTERTGGMSRIWLASLAATGVLGLAMLLGRWLWQAPLPPEMLYNYAARLLGVPWVFNLVHSLPFGLDIYAKYVLFVLSTGFYLGLWLLLGRAYPSLLRVLGRWGASLIFVAVSILGTGLVLLPIQGLGVFGLSPDNFFYQPRRVVLWTALFGLIFFLALEMTYRRSVREHSSGRRESLRALAGVVLAFSSLAALGRLIAGAAASAQESVTTFLSRIRGVVPELTPAAEHYVVSKNIISPSVPEDRWSLRVTGLVERELELSMDDLKGLPQVERPSTLMCVSNPVGGDLIGNSLWTGVRLSEILNLAGPRADAREIILRAADNYSDSFPLAAGFADSVIVAYLQNGEPLTRDHGFPARVLIPGIYGMKNVKWLVELELADADYQGFWQTRGWSDEAVVKTMSRIDTVRATQLENGTWAVGGVAYAGLRGVRKVEVSMDGGATWQEAQLDPALNDLSWNLWGFSWDAEPGRHEFLVRATDGRGQTQTAERTRPLPDGATGYHQVRVRVG